MLSQPQSELALTSLAKVQQNTAPLAQARLAQLLAFVDSRLALLRRLVRTASRAVYHAIRRVKLREVLNVDESTYTPPCNG
jgi:hypothetical protein